jgi:16S rRNA G1207 methylase RsmC
MHAAAEDAAAGRLDPDDTARLITATLQIRPGQALADLACGAGGPGLWMARESGASLIAEMGEPAAAAAVAEAMVTIQIKPYPRRILAVASRPG